MGRFDKNKFAGNVVNPLSFKVLEWRHEMSRVALYGNTVQDSEGGQGLEGSFVNAGQLAVICKIPAQYRELTDNY